MISIACLHEDCFLWGFCVWSFTATGLLLCKIPSEDTPEEPTAIKTQKAVSQSFFDISFFDFHYL